MTHNEEALEILTEMLAGLDTEDQDTPYTDPDPWPHDERAVALVRVNGRDYTIMVIPDEVNWPLAHQYETERLQKSS